MSSRTFIQRLRAASPVEQARLLRSALNDSGGDNQGITTTLLNSVAEGRLPPPAIRTWLGITRSPEALASAFYQGHSVFTRDIAIIYIVKMLRKDKTFEATWEALGGTHGLGQHLATLSINQHRDLCAALGDLRWAGDEHYQKLRRERITELYDYLMDPSQNTHEGRPVKRFYARLLPSCAPERAWTYMKELDADAYISPRKLTEVEDLAKTDWTGFEQRALENAFAADSTHLDLKRLKIFIKHSQNFGLRVLEVIVSRKDLKISNEGDFMTELALPMVRGCVSKHRRKKTDVETHNHVWKLLNMCFEQYPNLRNGIEALAERPWFGNGSRRFTLLESAARSWNYCRGADVSSRNLAKLISFFSKRLLTWDKLGNLLESVAPGLRYGFLRIWLANSAHRREIGDVHGQSSASLKGLQLPPTIFTCLGAVDSLLFFERCSDANPDRSFLSTDNIYPKPSLLKQTQEPGPNQRPDLHIIRAFLIKRANPRKIVSPKNPESIIEALRTSELDRRKKLAKEGKEPEVRAFWVLSALRLCAALKDFGLLNETLIWARRFNKDPLAVKEIYPYFHITPFLACGVMTCEEQVHATKEELKQSLIEGNRTVRNLLETVVLIQAEKSFGKPDLWDGHTAFLAGRVAVTRLRKVRELQAWLKMTDEEVFEVLLRPTMDLLLETEATLIDHDSVDCRNQEGLMGYGSDQMSYSIKPPTAPEVRFWEALAIRRDELWERKRCSKRPEVMTLPSPWPRGLPAHALIPSAIQENVIVPYVTERTEAIVFCDPAVAFQPVPEDKVTVEAVGKFVDSYPDALRIWVGAGDGDEEQQERITRAWNYALGPLTGDRMTPKEAERFWHNRAFCSAERFPHVSVKFSTVRYPDPVSSLGETDVPSEWDPDPMYHQFSESKAHRIGSLTLLDCMLWSTNTHLSEIDEPWSESVSKESFWNSCWETNPWDQIRSVASRNGSSETAHAAIDALIAAAVLTVEGVHGQGSSLLRRSFPGSEDPRFPAMYLDEDFLERESDHTWPAIRALKSLRLHVPPELLVQLANSMWTKLNEETDSARWNYRQYVSVVQAIIESDNPSQSLPLIQKFVLESHDASSYFRDLLGATLMNRLNAHDASQMYESLTEKITMRLGEARAKKEATDNVSSAVEGQSAPSVKITTVKMLAQIPREGCAIATQQSIATLKSILCQASHIDIRSAALQSLIEAAVDEGSGNNVHGFLEEWAPKVAGSMSERRPETKEDWEAAEHGGPLPEVDGERPIMDILLEKVEPKCTIIRRSLESSAESNSRWTRLFVEKHGPAAFGGFSSELPSVPASNMGVLTILNRQTDAELKKHREPHFSLDLLESMRSYVLHLMDPPDWVTALTRYVENSAELSLSNAGLHWINLWQTGDLEVAHAKYLSVGADWACTTLNAYEHQYAYDDSNDANMTSVYRASAALEDFVFDMARTCIGKGNVEALYMLLDKLKPRWNVAKDAVCEGRGSGSVLRRIFEYVESLRTIEWQSDPQRHPSRLPDSILLRIRLLYLPTKGSDGANAVDRKHVSRLVEEAIALVHMIVDDKVPYDTRFRALRRKVWECCEDRLYVATLLGDVSTSRSLESPSLAELLRVRLAVFSMKEAKELGDWKGEAGIACRNLVKGWEGSLCEDLREQATDVRKWAEKRFARKEEEEVKGWFV